MFKIKKNYKNLFIFKKVITSQSLASKNGKGWIWSHLWALVSQGIGDIFTSPLIFWTRETLTTILSY